MLFSRALSDLRFGVGFYSTFVVADKVEAQRGRISRTKRIQTCDTQVYTKTADKEKGEQGYLWTSDGAQLKSSMGSSSRIGISRYSGRSDGDPDHGRYPTSSAEVLVASPSPRSTTCLGALASSPSPFSWSILSSVQSYKISLRLTLKDDATEFAKLAPDYDVLACDFVWGMCPALLGF